MWNVCPGGVRCPAQAVDLAYSIFQSFVSLLLCDFCILRKGIELNYYHRIIYFSPQICQELLEEFLL